MHPSEVQLRNFLEGIGAVDMDVDDFAGLTEDQRTRAIAKKNNADKKKMARLQIALENKQKKEAERLANLEKRKKEKQKKKEEKAKAKGKKNNDGNALVPTSSTVDHTTRKTDLSQPT